MYKLIRRISSSVFARPDRPWSDDATSSAPQNGRKRRLSSTEPDEPSPSVKKHRVESPEGSDDASQRDSSPLGPARETEGVKEVTNGVKEVELEEGGREEVSAAADATAVPLPDSPLLSAADDTKEAEADATDEPSSAKLIAIAEVAESAEEADEPAEDGAVETEQGKEQELSAEDEDIPGLSSSSKINGVNGVNEPIIVKATDDQTDAASTSTPTTTS